MADEKDAAKDEQTPATKSSGLTTLLLLVVVAIVFGAAGFAVPLVFPHLFQGPNTATVAQARAEPTEPAFIEFGEVVVNLNSDRFNRYLRVNLTMQVDASQQEEFNKRLALKKVILKNWLLSYLSDQGTDQIRGAAGQNRLRREIQNQFNEVLCEDGYDLIDDILFLEFGVQ